MCNVHGFYCKVGGLICFASNHTRDTILYNLSLSCGFLRLWVMLRTSLQAETHRNLGYPMSGFFFVRFPSWVDPLTWFKLLRTADARDRTSTFDFDTQTDDDQGLVRLIS